MISKLDRDIIVHSIYFLILDSFRINIYGLLSVLKPVKNSFPDAQHFSI